MIVGFEYRKIHIERKTPLSGHVKVNHHLSFEEVKEITLKRFDNKQALDLSFTFSIGYEPDVGSIEICGNIVYTDTSKILDQAITAWKKEKKVISEVSFEVINAILMKCNVKALELSEDLNLPAHIPLPQFKGTPQKYNSYIG